MFNLFLGDLWSIISTVLLLVVLAYILTTVVNYRTIKLWGKRILVLAVIGLFLCIAVVMRDDYVVAMQGGTGVFSLESMQIQLVYILAVIIGFSILSSIFIRNQSYRKMMFFLLSIAIIFKAVLIEISRIIM